MIEQGCAAVLQTRREYGNFIVARAAHVTGSPRYLRRPTGVRCRGVDVAPPGDTPPGEAPPRTRPAPTRSHRLSPRGGRPPTSIYASAVAVSSVSYKKHLYYTLDFCKLIQLSGFVVPVREVL